jgi:hypothetical protein
MRFWRIGLGLAACAVLAACGGAPRAQMTRIISGNPVGPYLGKTKTEIIACAGIPASTYKTDSGENLTYHYSGAGPVPGAQPEEKKKGGIFGGGGGKKEDKDYKCVATLNFQNDRLAGANYAPRGAVSPYATKEDPKTHEKIPVPMPEPCSFTLPQCTPEN